LEWLVVLCHIKKKWRIGSSLENPTDKDHIRGALKAHRKSVSKSKLWLKPRSLVDTVDEYCANLYN
jgi:hypothetical protein